MSANKFLAELERRRLLPDRTMARLRESLAGTDRPLTAEALARFLVQKNRLSDEQAREVLGGLRESGVNLLDEDASEAPGESSIFSSHIMSSQRPSSELDMPAAGAADDDEIRLIPLEDDIAPEVKQAAPKKEAPLLHFAPELLEQRSRRPMSREEEEMGGVAPAPDLKASGLTEEAARLKEMKGSDRASIGLIKRGQKKEKERDVGKDKEKKKKARSRKERKRWDSPLILVGGGGLTLLLLVGGTVWYLLFRESGDQKLAQAKAALNSGQFGPAIAQYEEFLKDYPRHPEHSTARVQLAMVRIRQPTESGDFAAALSAAENELKSVEDEEAFKDPEVHGDLAAILPQIAQGAATAAEKADPSSDDPKKLTEVANQALALCNNVAYVPKTLRVEAKFADIQDTLDRVARRQQSHVALSEGLKAIEQAAAEGKPIAAYAAHMKLLKEHPELAGDASLAAAIQKTTAAELAAIKFVKEAKPAETTERPVPWRAALAVANRRVKPASPLAGVSGTAAIQLSGAIYGIDAASGHLLWRRPIGFGASQPPIPIENDFIAVDATHNELLRLDAATGQLVWRQTIGEPFTEPLITEGNAFVATKTGRLYVVDLKSGGRTGYLQFGQPLPVAPIIDRQKTRIYLPGDQASLYSITLSDMKCVGVNYLGHSAGSIRVPLATVADKVAVIENDGVETSRLHLMSLDPKGAIGKQVIDRRLNGLAASPPIVTGRGMIIVTDRGQIEVYDIATGAGPNALTLVATREATSTQPLVRYAAVAGRNVWMADTQLTKYSIVPAGNQLPVLEIENNFAGDTFDHPMSTFGDVLIHVRRPKSRAGYVVAATDTKNGHPLWETDLAIPPAGPPVVDEASKSLVVASAEGHIFRFDESAIRSRMQDEATPTEMMPTELPALAAAVDLGQGRAALCAPGSNRLLLYNPAGNASAKWLQLESPLACPVTPFGQGFLAPTKIGQVFYLNSADGSRLATPYQPHLEPQSSVEFKSADAVGNDGRQFVIVDAQQRIYLVALSDKPEPHLEEIKQADVGPHPIEAPPVVIGDVAIVAAAGTHIVQFKLPSLQTVGEANLPSPLEWGPYRVGDNILIATADDKLIALSTSGEVKWQLPTGHGPLAGPPLVLPDGIVLAYRKGVVERRSAADGKPQAAVNLEQPLATGAVPFMQRLTVVAGDGTLLVVDKP